MIPCLLDTPPNALSCCHSKQHIRHTFHSSGFVFNGLARPSHRYTLFSQPGASKHRSFPTMRLIVDGKLHPCCLGKQNSTCCTSLLFSITTRKISRNTAFDLYIDTLLLVHLGCMKLPAARSSQVHRNARRFISHSLLHPSSRVRQSSSFISIHLLSLISFHSD